MTDVIMNLGKAQKLLDRIKAEIKKYSYHQDTGSNRYGVIPIYNQVCVQYSHQGSNKMEQELQESVNNEIDNLQEYINLLEDLANVKEALFVGNIKSGISDILNRIEVQKKTKEIWERYQKGMPANRTNFVSTESLPDYYNSEIKRHQTLAVQSSFAVYREIYSEEELKDAIRECNKVIDQLEDQRDEINHTHRITVKLSETTTKALGLN